MTGAGPTSSSLQARPPPVDAGLRFLEIPYSWRSIASDVGVYVAGKAICSVGDMVIVVVVVIVMMVLIMLILVRSGWTN